MSAHVKQTSGGQVGPNHVCPLHSACSWLVWWCPMESDSRPHHFPTYIGFVSVVGFLQHRGEEPSRSSGHTISKEEIFAPRSLIPLRNCGHCRYPPLLSNCTCQTSGGQVGIVGNPNHVLAPLIPPSKSHPYNLRNRRHDMQIPPTQTNSDKNVIIIIILDLNSTWTK